MTKTHKIYIISLVAIVLAVLAYLILKGISYYRVPIEERFFHTDYANLKPSGPWGHGLGIIGSLFMIIGVAIYMLRKRMRSLSRLGILKHWLEFHIFLCTLGPILVLFHTSFKFGGIVAVSFWSMVAVFLSGVVGRFIYIQIPRSIEGRELTLNEVREMKTNLGEILSTSFRLDEWSYNMILESTRKKTGLHEGSQFWYYTLSFFQDFSAIRRIKVIIAKNNLNRTEKKQVLRLVRNEISLNRKIDRLLFMQNLFKYWHVAHLPFAIIMLIVMIIHVAVTIVFGYRWIF
jgi:hypothetical protein